MKKAVRKESRIATSPFPPQAHKPAKDTWLKFLNEMTPPVDFSHGTPGNSVTDKAVSGPRAPINQQTILGQLDEALKWSGQLNDHLSAINARLFGQDPSEGSALASATIDAQLAALSSRLASMCGYAATILDRIGEV